METKKWRVVCYVNQFFGQIGGEDMAHVGFSVEDKKLIDIETGRAHV